MDDALSLSGKLLSDSLKRLNIRIVFAESCSAGLASATLAANPGVSQWHCGSAVTYRNDTKQRWLQVPPELLNPPGPGPVSEQVAQAMALGVLAMTPEAEVSAAITGHLGPDAEVGLDGVIWIAVARRQGSSAHMSDATRPPEIVMARQEVLPATAAAGFTVRETRQRLAAQRLLEAARRCLESDVETWGT